jgi:hypothetical protein
LRELREQGLISVRWVSNVGMSSDILTKNVGGKDFHNHRDVYVREQPSVQSVEAPTTTYPLGEGVGARSPSVDSDWNGGKGSGSDGTESVVELVGSADTLAGRSSEWKTVEGRSLKMKKSLEMKKSPEERKQINTKVSCDKDYN